MIRLCFVLLFLALSLYCCPALICMSKPTIFLFCLSTRDWTLGFPNELHSQSIFYFLIWDKVLEIAKLANLWSSHLSLLEHWEDRCMPSCLAYDWFCNFFPLILRSYSHLFLVKLFLFTPLYTGSRSPLLFKSHNNWCYHLSSSSLLRSQMSHSEEETLNKLKRVNDKPVFQYDESCLPQSFQLANHFPLLHPLNTNIYRVSISSFSPLPSNVIHWSGISEPSPQPVPPNPSSDLSWLNTTKLHVMKPSDNHMKCTHMLCCWGMLGLPLKTVRLGHF